WCSVVTTAVYCRPSCPSRHARLEHVRFHDTLAEARRTGFRPCRRCRPEGLSLGAEQAALVARARLLIRERRGRISSIELANALGMSRGHFHKVFRRVTGQSPGAFKRQISLSALDAHPTGPSERPDVCSWCVPRRRWAISTLLVRATSSGAASRAVPCAGLTLAWAALARLSRSGVCLISQSAAAVRASGVTWSRYSAWGQLASRK